MLADLIVGKVDLLLISETKIDDTFPSSQFQISGFSAPFRLDRTQNGGGIMLYVGEDIPAKCIHSNIISGNFECFFMEINLYKKQWLIVSTYIQSMQTHHFKSPRCFAKMYGSFSDPL